MPRFLRPSVRQPALALGCTVSAVLWGVIEFVALSRSRWLRRGPGKH